MAHLRDLNSIEELNDWVGGVANAENMIIDRIRNVMEADLQGTLGRFFGPLENAQIMAASGNRMDCLIHSFLSCCSSNFRRLKPNANKNAVADLFRRKLLPWFVDNDLLQYDRDALMSDGSSFAEDGYDGMLDDDLGRELADKFRVNILFVETAPDRTAQLKACHTDEVDRTIVIHNQQRHFSPVKISDHENYFTEIFNAQVAMATALGNVPPEINSPRGQLNVPPENSPRGQLNVPPENSPRGQSGGFRKTKRRRGGNRKSKKYRRVARY